MSVPKSYLYIDIDGIERTRNMLGQFTAKTLRQIKAATIQELHKLIFGGEGYEGLVALMRTATEQRHHTYSQEESPRPYSSTQESLAEGWEGSIHDSVESGGLSSPILAMVYNEKKVWGRQDSSPISLIRLLDEGSTKGGWDEPQGATIMSAQAMGESGSRLLRIPSWHPGVAGSGDGEYVYRSSVRHPGLHGSHFMEDTMLEQTPFIRERLAEGTSRIFTGVAHN